MVKNSYFILYKLKGTKYKDEYQTCHDLIIQPGTCANYIMHKLIDHIQAHLAVKVRDNQIEFKAITVLFTEEIY